MGMKQHPRPLASLHIKKLISIENYDNMVSKDHTTMVIEDHVGVDAPTW